MNDQPPNRKRADRAAPFLFWVCGQRPHFSEYRDPAKRQADALFHSLLSPALCYDTDIAICNMFYA
jgi:hypothetical protein